jgi:hypothetical protein
MMGGNDPTFWGWILAQLGLRAGLGLLIILMAIWRAAGPWAALWVAVTVLATLAVGAATQWWRQR